jgi:hypothetical protein
MIRGDSINTLTGPVGIRQCRPALSAPDPVTGAPARALGQGQPLFGLAGLTFLVPVSFVLAFGVGGPVTSLEILAPLTTFALPVIATIAFWWEDWPGSTLRAGWSGLTDTLVAMLFDSWPWTRLTPNGGDDIT